QRARRGIRMLRSSQNKPRPAWSAEGHGALPSPRGSRRGLLRAGDKGVEVADVHKYASTLTSSPLRGVGKGDHDAREDAHGEPLAHARLRNSKVYGGIAAPEQPR